VKRAAWCRPPEDPEKYFALRPKGPKDYRTYYDVTVPAFIDETGRALDRNQAADILTESAKNDALKAFEILCNRFTRKEG
jgi:hypothetical protein